MTPEWTFTHCLACKGQAWRAPDGELFCGTCEQRTARLGAALASVAAPAPSLRAQLLAGAMMAA